MKTITPLSETYKELGIAFTFPIKIEDENGNRTYFERSDGLWWRYEYDENGNETYYETSGGYWSRHEYDENGKETYYKDRYGLKKGTKRGSSGEPWFEPSGARAQGKVVEVDGKKYNLYFLPGKKYKLMEL